MSVNATALSGLAKFGFARKKISGYKEVKGHEMIFRSRVWDSFGIEKVRIDKNLVLEEVMNSRIDESFQPVWKFKTYQQNGAECDNGIETGVLVLLQL